jgi:hypothetical protein
VGGIPEEAFVREVEAATAAAEEAGKTRGIGLGQDEALTRAGELYRKPETIVTLVRGLDPEARQKVMEGIRGQGNWLTRMFGG